MKEVDSARDDGERVQLAQDADLSSVDELVNRRRASKDRLPKKR